MLENIKNGVFKGEKGDKGDNGKDGSNYILTEKTTYNSNNNLSKETYSYPFNYTIEPYKEMTLKNILSQTVSTTEQTGNDYKVQKNNFIKIEIKFGW